jgi:hypothetical protein
MSYCKPVFKQDQEKELAEYVFVMENRFLGLILTEMRGLDFGLAERNEISHIFNKTIKWQVKKTGSTYFSKGTYKHVCVS